MLNLTQAGIKYRRTARGAVDTEREGSCISRERERKRESDHHAGRERGDRRLPSGAVAAPTTPFSFSGHLLPKPLALLKTGLFHVRERGAKQLDMILILIG